ncbi:MAG: hypothetical protein HY875_10440 [Chloroflexi bacterium]|nr:hypothetical protein [Chloroflexota bacterium]
MRYVAGRLAVVTFLSVGAFLFAHHEARTLDPGAWVANGHFDTATPPWALGGSWDGVTFDWSSADRNGSRTSGSGRITIQAGFTPNPYAVQCRPVPAGATTATLAGSILYPVDSGSSNAWLQGAFFAGNACTGQYLGNMGGGVFEAQSAWTDITSIVSVPPNAVSVLVQLGLLADIGAPALTANFDEIALTFDHMPSHRVIAANVARQ